MTLINVALPTATAFSTLRLAGLPVPYTRSHKKSGKPVFNRELFMTSKTNSDKRQQTMSPTMDTDLQIEISADLTRKAQN